MGEAVTGESGATAVQLAESAPNMVPAQDFSNQCSRSEETEGEEPGISANEAAPRASPADDTPGAMPATNRENLANGSQGGKKKRRRRLLQLKVKATAVSQLTWSHMRHGMKDPVNIAALIWILLALPACVIIGLKEVGLLQAMTQNETVTEKINEVAHQLMNALFVLAVAVILPLLVRQTYLLVRWRPRDRAELRNNFCKNGTRKPHDRTHMAIVLFWGQLTCWATLVYAAMYWFWPPDQRSDAVLWAMGITSWVAPIVGLLYLLLSPLSREFSIIKEGDDQMLKMYQRSHAFFLNGKRVTEPQWSGSAIPGCCTERRTACLVCFLPCCMFGYNMERLGFGHRAVQAFAFAIMLLGPLLVFELSAAALGAWGVSSLALYICGLVLAVLGFAYGGLWRTRLRQVYGLPASKICCGSAWMTDICLWTWCGYCALCQEIRTADQYHVEGIEAPRETGQQPYTFDPRVEQNYGGDDTDEDEVWEEERDEAVDSPQNFNEKGMLPVSTPAVTVQRMTP